MAVAFGLFAMSAWAIRFLDTELIPELSEGEFYFEVKLPEGALLDASDRTLQGMEQAAAAEPALARQYATVGSRLAAGGMSMVTRAENLGQRTW